MDEQKNLKGKGHELSDFNKLMTGMKDWHNQFAPKVEYNFFVTKLNKAGKDKVLQGHMCNSHWKGQKGL